MSAIFISYRRIDSDHFAARLRESLELKLGPDEVFLDVEDIMAGKEWKQRLKVELNNCDILIVVIGGSWLDELRKRISTEDQVLWEIQTAIELDKTIIPIVIDNVDMPKETDLPEQLRKLAGKNAVYLRSNKANEFESVVAELLEVHGRIRTIRPDKAANSLNLLLNSQIDILSRYASQSNLLTVKLANGSDYVVPAVEVLNASDGRIESQLEVGFVESQFSVSVGSAAAFEIYKADATGRGKSFYNTKTARLIGVSCESNVRLTFQPTSYFDYVKTNMAMDFEDRINGNLRDEVHGDGRLEDLSHSRLANHTGISGLVFSRDGQMIVQRRSPKVFTYPNQLSPGFSGTLTSGDIAHLFKRGETTCTIAAVDVLRELEEELGVDQDLITDRCFMGLSRELMRGGLPELFYAVDVNMTANEILDCFAKDREGETLAFPLQNGRARLKPEDAARLRARFDMLIMAIEEAGARRASFPLISNLAFWVNQHDAPICGGNRHPNS